MDIKKYVARILDVEKEPTFTLMLAFNKDLLEQYCLAQPLDHEEISKTDDPLLFMDNTRFRVLQCLYELAPFVPVNSPLILGTYVRRMLDLSDRGIVLLEVLHFWKVPEKEAELWKMEKKEVEQVIEALTKKTPAKKKAKRRK